MKKKIIAFFTCICMVLTFSACGGTETSTEPSEETTVEETTEATTEAEELGSEYGDFTTEDDYSSVEYDKLARTPDDYEGDKIKITGEVIQVMEGDGETDLRIALDESWDDVILAYYSSDIVESRILEEDNVTAYGVAEGLYTYESTGSGDITIPIMYVQKIVIN